jgi:lipid II:glycine glycyltransferase (peptidoglycan interpeptide bridge formation enzyme)
VVATVDGHSVGGLVSIATEDRALIWQGGVLPDFRGTHANVLLYWDAIKWAHRIGVGSIDLVGVPDEGIGRFKSQFGASLTEYVVGQRQSAFGRLIEKTRRNALTRS